MTTKPQILLARAGIVFGLGLGGLFDGIVLHQILGWHHMICTTETCQPNSIGDDAVEQAAQAKAKDDAGPGQLNLGLRGHGAGALDGVVAAAFLWSS